MLFFELDEGFDAACEFGDFGFLEGDAGLEGLELSLVVVVVVLVCVVRGERGGGGVRLWCRGWRRTRGSSRRWGFRFRFRGFLARRCVV